MSEAAFIRQVFKPMTKALEYLHFLGKKNKRPCWGSNVERATSHIAGVDHLALKPENILFTSDGTLKLADVCSPVLGHSSPAGEEDPVQLRALQYLPPEVGIQRPLHDAARSLIAEMPSFLPPPTICDFLSPQVVRRLDDPLFDGKGAPGFSDAVDSYAVGAIVFETLVRNRGASELGKGSSIHSTPAPADRPASHRPRSGSGRYGRCHPPAVAPKPRWPG